jgi:hypothetical protein
LSLVDLEGSNEEEINMIRELIEKYSGSFCLNTEFLPATHLTINKIKISMEEPIKTKQYLYPTKLNEQVQKEVDKTRARLYRRTISVAILLTDMNRKHEDEEGNK